MRRADAARDTALLTSLLAAEHASVYAYGVLGARLDEGSRALALQAFDAHRARRSALVTRLQSLGAPVPAPLAAYDVTAADRASALRLAVRLEVEGGRRWRDLVAVTDDPSLRALAVQALTDTAVRAARWRQLAGIRPLTEAFPGQDQATS